MQKDVEPRSLSKNKQNSIKDQERIFLTLQILKKSNEKISFDEEQMLSFLFQKHAFIISLNNIGDVNLLSEYCPYISCAEVESNQFVIQNGEQGDFYYCLLAGQININSVLFGKEALSSQPYSQDVFTLEDSKFLMIKRQDFIEVITKAKLKDSNQQIDFFKETQLFGKLSKQTIASILHNFELVLFRKNQIVYREGDISDFVYLIKDGEFELSKQFDLRNKHKLLPVTTIGKLEQFGDLDCLLNTNRQYTVKCKEAASCYRINNQNFYSIISKNPHSSMENYVNQVMRTQTLSRQERLKTASSVVSGNRDFLLGIPDENKNYRETLSNNRLNMHSTDKATHCRYAQVYSNFNRKQMRVRYATLHDQQAAVVRCGSKNQESSNRKEKFNQLKGQLFDEVIIPDRIKRKYQHQLMDIKQQTIRKQQLVIRTQNNCSQIIVQSHYS